MKLLLNLIAVIFFFVAISNALRLSLSVYPNRTYLDKSVSFVDSVSNLACVYTLMGDINSACYTGFWIHAGPLNTIPLGPANNFTCYNFTQPQRYVSTSTIRKLGPRDDSTPAIVFWSGSGATNYTVIEKLAEANVTVEMNLPTSTIITYGNSNWTLFSGANFVGSSACLVSKEMVSSFQIFYETDIGLTTVQSAIKGCDLRSEYINLLREN